MRALLFCLKTKKEKHKITKIAKLALQFFYGLNLKITIDFDHSITYNKVKGLHMRESLFTEIVLNKNWANLSFEDKLKILQKLEYKISKFKCREEREIINRI